jgi:Icc-related predicted phosphoesterase
VTIGSHSEDGGQALARPPVTLRVAAAGDIHCHDSRREETAAAFAALDGRVDLVLLAGDLTSHGTPDEAQILADAARRVDAPVIAVLGNHDWHGGHSDDIVRILEGAGVRVLDRSSTVCELRGVEVGIVGTKGFVGGFPGSYLPDFGEPLLRQVYAEGVAEVDAIDAGLRAVEMCPVRIVMVHYAPTDSTLEGEPPGIWAFLGTDRMAAPIAEHAPDLVVHGHAHAGRFEGRIGEVPVYNVSVPVMERDFWLFELSGVKRTGAAVH